MSNSMISTVLEIEDEAEAVLRQAEQDAGKIAADAKARRAEIARMIEGNVKREVADLEALAAVEREKKIKELTATGDAALAAVKHISDAAYDSGVQHIMKALAGK